MRDADDCMIPIRKNNIREIKTKEKRWGEEHRGEQRLNTIRREGKKEEEAGKTEKHDWIWYENKKKK